MFKKICFFFLTLFLLTSAGFAFDLEKARSDYRGANFEISSVKEILHENAPAISISFTVPLSRAHIRDYQITLSGGESEHWIISKDQTKIIFPFVSTQTRYTVRVNRDIRDINGNYLKNSFKGTLKTKRLTPTVNFTSSGHILSSSGPKKLTVTTLNVKKINIDFFSIRRDKIPSFLNYMSKNGKFGYYKVNSLKKYGELAYTGRFNLNPKKNQRTDFNINLANIRQLRKPGLYAAVMTRAGSYSYDYEFAYFMQTNIGIHTRKYKNQIDVYAQDITSGRPLGNVKVEILSRKGEITGYERRTGPDGYISFGKKKYQDYLVATRGDQFSVLPLNRNALDLSGLKNATSSHSEYQIYAFGPRDLYRPSEKINVNILVRNYDGRIPPMMPLGYTLYKPNGSRVNSDRIQPDSRGFYKFSYKTDKSSQTGRYRLRLKFGETNSNYYFKLEEFLPERLDLKLFDGKYDKRIVQKRRTINVPVSSKYLYGSPASGNKVDGTLTVKVDPHPFEKLPTFHFGDVKERIRRRTQRFRDIKLSGSGTGELKMYNHWERMKSPVKFNVRASVYESGGRPVTRNSSFTMLNGDYFFGIEPQFAKRPDSNSTVKIKIGCVDPRGNWVRNKRVQVKLIRKDRNWYWRYLSSRGWHWAWSESPVVVFSKNVFVGKHALVNLPLSWGSYRIEVKDRRTMSSYDFQTSWSWWGNSSDSNMQKPDQISLGFEKTTYRPGDYVKLKINPPKSGLALITVESSDGVLYRVFKRVRSEGTIVQIKTEKTWDRHDLYASVMVIKPGNMTKTPVPTRSFGMVHIPLKRENTKLEVSIKAPEKIEPNRFIKARIRVKSGSDLPQNTKVIVSLVDVGILNITRFKTPDAESYFFAPRRYNIDLYDNYGQVIDNIGPKNARHKFGGGFRESQAELTRGGDKPKSEVMMVSFMSNPVRVNRFGEAEVQFKLPNFNGKLRWMVLAYSDEQFGKTDKDTKVADKIVTQISMPRFLAAGDKSSVSLDLHNLSGRNQRLSLKVNTGGAIEKGVKRENLILSDQEKRTILFPVSAVSYRGQGTIKLQVTNSDDIEIKREWKLGVRPAYPGITRKFYSVINPDSMLEPQMVTNDLKPDSVRFQMTVSNRPPINFASHLEYLLRYPYGCLEQSISSGYPWVVANQRTVDSLGLNKIIQKRFKQDFSEGFRQEQIKKAIDLVLNRIKSNGSFGSWSSSSPEHEWLTVYAADFLFEAKKAGASISYNTVNSINRRLRKYLQGNYLKQNRWSNDASHYEFAFRSYAGYVLAKKNLVSLSHLRRLSMQFKGRTGDDGLSWMYMAAAFKMAGDYYNADTCYRQALREKNRERNRYYSEYGSKVRDLAVMSELAFTYRFQNKEMLLYDLSNAVKDRRWMSTQEKIALFKTAAIIEVRRGRIWNAGLIINGREQRVSKSNSFNTVFDLNTFKNFKGIRSYGDTLYATITLVGIPEKAPRRQSNVLNIERSFFDTKGNRIYPGQMKSGDLAVVKLQITAKKRTPDGLVVDLLPAGLEIENQNLGLSSVKLNDIRIDGKQIGKIVRRGEIKHEEFRDDRYVAAIDINTYRPVILFYLVRAVTPGTYKFPCSYVEDMYRPYRFGIGSTRDTIRVFK